MRCFAPCAYASIDNVVVAKNTSNVVLVLAHVKSMIVVATFGITHAAYDFIIKHHSVLSNGSTYQITYDSLGIERVTAKYGCSTIAALTTGGLQRNTISTLSDNKRRHAPLRWPAKVVTRG